MNVLKFGGTSIENSERIRNILAIIREALRNGPVIVVVSAIRKVTDLLLDAAIAASGGDERYRTVLDEIERLHTSLVADLLEGDAARDTLEYLHEGLRELRDVLHGVCLLRELSDKSTALVMSFGERFSARIVSSFLSSEGVPSVCSDARDLIVTDTSHCDARVDMVASSRRIGNSFDDIGDVVPVVTGYIGAAPDGTVTTLGRGGSDYTATIIGSVLGAGEIQIWTDVDGFFSADPKRVHDAFALPFISYTEAMELSHAGAKVLHPYAVHPAMKAGIPVIVKNSLDPSVPGTRIENAPLEERVPPGPVTGLSSISNIVLLTLSGSGMVGVPGIASRLFSCLARHMINIIFISQASSEQSISIVINAAQAAKARKILEAEFASELKNRQVESLSVRRHIAMIAIVGRNMAGHPGVSAHLFETLGKNGINVVAVAQGANEMNISFVIDSHDEDKALNCIHESFLLSRRKVHVFIAGTGTIAKSLIGQIREHREILRTEKNLDVVVSGMANTRMIALNDSGIDLQDWENALVAREGERTIADYIGRIKSRNLHNTIFVDCTASGDVAKAYPELLASNISVVTANKLGMAGSWDLYEAIDASLQGSNARFLYETNVGAGLPIINTLNDLRNSGDKIFSIEGVLSGTLSYIFNELRKGGSFSDIVRSAREAGFTEPDPREDLSGADFARKFLILGRELGYRMDYDDIECESLVPEGLRGEMSVDEFLDRLSCIDAHYDDLNREAAGRGMTIAYAGEICEGKARISVKMLPLDNPVAGLNGTENMVVFTTGRYHSTPLVVKGPGAGGEVTAGGVFADILRIASYLI
ncbi:bifunctional aspartate kinase/homoserine dehydrogenase I [Prosthecochloris sp. HL-130-GSB]|uniref:bifunctional aspartate kinase/homoserine dehydrogenase I n=1 Tax=Prosthecochloris sp. HL-130-GSB TaxID=1974213 RepID=UPI000A1C08C1|nr:bifunctional aspartate kinase/homoserine dehydrogenase I [Prosthecochloris sp. HL-130-GSB]ARM30193.1 bifunctional aspartate kinase/homoserine dehydrogenase I [Prosthecochloris sp. HL-130-GSB]